MSEAIEIALADHLAAAAPVTALLAQRIHMARVPQGSAWPAARVALLNDRPEHALEGVSSLHMAILQVDVYAEAVAGVDAYAQVEAGAAAIDGVISGYKGPLGTASPALECFGFLRVERRPLDEELEELRLVRMLLVYHVWYRA